jgi:enamine deaminase RidA (YjgF/YER057c/UK114 family)
MSAEKQLELMGVELPEPPKPMGAYVPALVVGSLAFVSGEKASVEGEMAYSGKVGGDLTIEEGYEAARICGLNCLAALRSALNSLDDVERVVKVVGYVNSAPGFNQQPKVVNGASELFLEVFGDSGQHARVAVGVNELPDDSPVEVSMIVKLRDEGSA